MKVELLSKTENPVGIIYTACRTCYSKYNPIEIYNSEIDTDKKISLIKKVIDSGHLSTTEHIYFTFALCGVSRALLAQITRHRLCLSGDTNILRFSGGKKSKTIQKLYEEWQIPQRRGPLSRLTIRTVNLKNSKVITDTKISNVFFNGVQDVYEIKTKLGYNIKCTLGHKFFNSNGEFSLGELNVGDKVYVNGIELYKNKEWFENKYIKEGYNTTQIANMCGIKPITARKWKQKHRIPTNNKNFKREFTYDVRNKISKANSGKIVSEITRNKLSKIKKGKYYKEISKLGESRLRTIHRKYKKNTCAICGSSKNLEVHHIDKDYKNYSENNCITLCSKCHHYIHGKNYKFKQVFEDEIISIKYIGKENTYDLETVSDNHNYIANGFLVHNCSFSVQSQRYVEIKENSEDLKVLRDFGSELDQMKMIDKYFVLEKYSRENALFLLNSLIFYRELIENGERPENARMYLPNATKTNIVISMNLREFMHLCNLRLCKHAQNEIRKAVEYMKDEVLKYNYYNWLGKYFVPNCKNCTDFRDCKEIK